MHILLLRPRREILRDHSAVLTVALGSQASDYIMAPECKLGVRRCWRVRIDHHEQVSLVLPLVSLITRSAGGGGRGEGYRGHGLALPSLEEIPQQDGLAVEGHFQVECGRERW